MLRLTKIALITCLLSLNVSALELGLYVTDDNEQGCALEVTQLLEEDAVAVTFRNDPRFSYATCKNDGFDNYPIVVFPQSEASFVDARTEYFYFLLK